MIMTTRQSRAAREAAYLADPQSHPVPHAEIQIGDYVQILPPADRDDGLAVYGYVTSYERFGNRYTIFVCDQPHVATGSRLRPAGSVPTGP
jgi:hypothetical protein